ncbi:MAG TPA: hypothetical protein VH208_03560 [Myxococcaceae bacterium]|nr:hypothetical protein [Myxococcaceae bacterium]
MPKGYVGTQHETIGSDIISVLQVCTMPNQVLGADLAERLRKVKADQWYPIQLLLEAMDILAERVGHAGLIQMGRALFRLSHQARVKEVARSAADIIFSLDDMYHHANRGEQIGGWRVTAFSPGMAKMEKTTPHHCWMEEGILAEALRAVDVAAFVNQTECFRKGAGACVFTITSLIQDARWMGGRSPI